MLQCLYNSVLSCRFYSYCCRISKFWGETFYFEHGIYTGP